MPVSADSTKHQIKWKRGTSLDSVIDGPVRIKYYITNSKRCSFWISQDASGKSGGATFAVTGTWDV